jgi:hypothetical protein
MGKLTGAAVSWGTTSFALDVFKLGDTTGKVVESPVAGVSKVDDTPGSNILVSAISINKFVSSARLFLLLLSDITSATKEFVAGSGQSLFFFLMVLKSIISIDLGGF